MSKPVSLIASLFLLVISMPEVSAETRDLIILDDDAAPFIYTSGALTRRRVSRSTFLLRRMA